jgi:hypothetical protein
MPYPGQITGLPRPLGALGTGPTATHRLVFRNGTMTGTVGGGRIIDGSKSRDSGNTNDTDTLRPGLMLGKITSSGKYAPSIIGVTSGAVAVGATTVSVTAAQAAELLRRVGASGTFTLRGPAIAGGPVVSETVTYSAISGTDITVTALTNPYLAGSFVQPTDGSDSPVTVVPDGYGIRVTDSYDQTVSADAEFDPPIAGVIDDANSGVILWPSEVSLQQWIKSRLRDSGAAFVFAGGF